MEHNEFFVRKQDSCETFNILYSNSRERSCDFGTAEKRSHRIQIIALFRQRTSVEIGACLESLQADTVILLSAFIRNNVM